MKGFKLWIEQDNKQTHAHNDTNVDDATNLLQQSLKNLLNNANKDLLPIQQQHPELYQYLQTHGLGNMTVLQIRDLANDRDKLARIVMKVTKPNPNSKAEQPIINKPTNYQNPAAPKVPNMQEDPNSSRNSRPVQPQSIPQMPPPSE